MQGRANVMTSRNVRFWLIWFSWAALSGCNGEKTQTRLIYYGFDDHSEKTVDAIQLAKTWGDNAPCLHWRSTINKKDADYQVLFGGQTEIQKGTIIDRRGQLLYSGGGGGFESPPGESDRKGGETFTLNGEIKPSWAPHYAWRRDS